MINLLRWKRTKLQIFDKKQNKMKRYMDTPSQTPSITGAAAAAAAMASSDAAIWRIQATAAAVAGGGGERQCQPGRSSKVERF